MIQSPGFMAKFDQKLFIAFSILMEIAGNSS
jgi:hypothetical protein